MFMIRSGRKIRSFYSPNQLVSRLALTVLKLNLVAHKPLRDGTLKPAQASEIIFDNSGLKGIIKGFD